MSERISGPTRSARFGRWQAFALVLAAAIPMLLLTYFSITISTRTVISRSEKGASAAADESATFLQQQVNAVVDRVDSYGERRVAPPLGDGTRGQIDLGAVNTQLAQLNSSKTGIDSSFVTDLDGNLMAIQPAGPALGQPLQKEEWYLPVSLSHRPYVTSITSLAGGLNPNYIGVATVLRAGGQPGGQTIGYMVSAYNLAGIQASVDDFRNQQSIGLTVVDRHGQVLARPNIPGQELGPQNLYSDLRVRDALKGKSSVVREEIQGTRVFAAYAPAPGIGWVVIASSPAAQDLADVDRLRNTVLAIAGVMALALLGILIAGLWLMQRAQESNRLKSEFLATISHELRTPLAAIVGYSDLILSGADGDLNPDLKEDVGEINRSGKLMRELIDDILDLAKLEAGRIQLGTEPISVPTLVEDVMVTMRPLADSKHLELKMEPGNGDLVAIADGGRVRQILSNLVSNAIKFTSEGGVTIDCRRRQDMIEVSVSDTGIGISEPALRLIFEKFTQADGSSTRKFGGTGLGLSICRELVELLHGQMGVESKPGKGSRFWFSLPAVQVETRIPLGTVPPS